MGLRALGLPSWGGGFGVSVVGGHRRGGRTTGTDLGEPGHENGNMTQELR